MTAVFIISGIINVFLIFLLSYKLHHNIILSLLVAFLLFILPWHILLVLNHSSYIFILNIIMTVCFLHSKKILNLKKIGVFLIVSSLVFYFLSTFAIPEYTNVEVDFQRTYASKTAFKAVSSIFSNKIIESYRNHEKKLFENLDFGNYFFQGHPRERSGVKEIPKFYISMLPLLVLGLLSQTFNFRWFFAGMLIFSSIILPELLILPVTYLSGLGIISFKKYSKPILVITLIEFIFFSTYLFGGYW